MWMMIGWLLVAVAPAVAKEDSLEKVRAAYAAANEAVAEVVVNADTPEERSAALDQALSREPGRAVDILAAIKEQENGAPVLSEVYAEMLRLLGGDDGHDKLVRQLMDDNPDILAEMVDQVEPAAGN
jgi:hypothetical protein